MWRRSPTTTGAFARLGVRRLPPRRPSARPFSHDASHASPELPPVRIVGPVLWSVAAIGTICFTCAAYEVRRDLQKYDPSYRSRATDKDLEVARKMAVYPQARKARESKLWYEEPFESLGDPRRLWETTPDSARALASVAGVNIATQVVSSTLSRISPDLYAFLLANLAHIPAAPPFRYGPGLYGYHTLLTCAFVHSGPWHLAANMMVVYNFGPGLTRKTNHALQYSGSGCLAYCLSAAITSTLGSHISTAFWPNKLARLGFGLGFSGVASALVATTCVLVPHVQIGIIFLPFRCEAQDFLQGLKIFEALGVIGVVGRLMPFMRNIGFAAHLSGLLFGEAYARWSRHGNFDVWLWFRSKAFHTMKKLGAV